MDYRQIYKKKREYEEQILQVCPSCPRESGIYFLIREENGIKYAYVGKAKNLLERLGSHLAGYKQYIDKSLKKHGLWSEENQTGYRIYFLKYPESVLNEKEDFYIHKYAVAGYQMRNVESGGNLGKSDIGERKPSRNYYDGLEQGFRNAQKIVKHLFDLHLDFIPKKNPPTKLQENAVQKFKDFLDLNHQS